MSAMSTGTALRTLAYEAIHSPRAVRRGARALAWHGTEFLVSMPDLDTLVSTMDTVPDLDGAIRIGAVKRPRTDLLRALYDARGTTMVTRVATFPSPWVWRRTTDGTVTGIVVRQHTYWDVHEFVTGEGLGVRVVPSSATTEEVLLAAREVGSVIVDVDEQVDEQVAGEVLADGDELGSSVAIGLLERQVEEDAGYFWLSMRPQRERPGVLADALTTLAQAGIDLDFLHSDDLDEGQHCFYVGFGSDPHGVTRLQSTLEASGMRVKVLGAFHEVVE